MKDIRNQSNNASVQSNSASVQECYSTAMQESCSAEAQNHRSTDLLPALRFNGFSEEWEVRKLGEVAEKVTEKNVGLQYKETFTNSAEFGIISQLDFFDHSVSKIDSLNGYYIVRSEDFVYNPRISVTAPVGPINRNKLGRSGVMSPLYTVFRPYEVGNTYLEFFFKSRCWHAYMYFNGDSGARSDRFSIKDDLFFKLPIPFPSLPEQSRIGAFFRSLDNLIALRTRKLEKLRNVKKAFLEKMFVGQSNSASEQECCSTETQKHHSTDLRPAIRFKGFDGEWEVRKLGEVAETLEYGLNAAAKEYDGKNKYIRITDIDDNSREFLQNDLSSPDICLNGMSKYLLSKGDIVFARTGASVGKTYIYREKDRIVYFAGFLIRAKVNQKNDADFIFQNTLTINYDNYIRVTSQRSGQPGVNAQEYSEYSLFVPSLPEQSRIGAFFKTLDHLIVLQEKELTKLKNIKQACLQRMFV